MGDLPSTLRGNPFSPEFGETPAALVGRESLLERLTGGFGGDKTALRSSTLLLGPRGSGKTVLLTALRAKADEARLMTLGADSATEGLPERIKQLAVAASRAARKLPSAPRLSGAGLFGASVSWEAAPGEQAGQDMGTVLASCARLARKRKTALLLTVDELHGGHRGELRRLANDIQIIAKSERLPLMFVGAGLSEMSHTLLRDNKMTFFLRCPREVMPPLSPGQAWAGLRKTIQAAGGAIAEDALRFAADSVGPLPYMLQLVGHHAWELADAPGSVIDLTACRQAARLAQVDFDLNVGLPAWEDLGQQEQDYLQVLATAGPEVSRREMGRLLPTVSGKQLEYLESRLTAAGHIAVDEHGTLDFCGPVTAALVKERIGIRRQYRPAEEIPTRRRRAAAGRCGAFMPRAKARCVLPLGHKGRHRSRV